MNYILLTKDNKAKYLEVLHELSDEFGNDLASNSSRATISADLDFEQWLTEEALSNPKCSLYVVEVAGEVVGYVLLKVGIESDVLWISHLKVFNRHSGRGYGSTILTWVKKTAKRNKYRSVLLHVSPDNTTAINVYKKASFNIHNLVMRCPL